MRPTITPPFNSQLFDRRLMLLLRRKGAQSMDYLAALPGFGWERVFFRWIASAAQGKPRSLSFGPEDIAYRSSDRFAKAIQTHQPSLASV